MSRIFSQQKFILLTFCLLMLGNSSFLTAKGLSGVFENLGYVCLLSSIFFRFIFDKYLLKKSKLFILFCINVLLFCAAFFVNNNLNSSVKMRLVFSMIIIAAVSSLAENYFSTFDDMRYMAYGMLLGTGIAFLLALLGHLSLTTLAVEGETGFGFNCGLQHKNYYGADMVSCFIIFYLLYKKYKKNIDKRCLFFIFFLILLSNSRASYIFLLVFISICVLDKLRNMDWRLCFLIIAFCIFVAVLFALVFYRFYALKSGSYLYRVQGLINYLNYYSNDLPHMLLGNSEMAFRDPSIDYASAVRSVIGWNGTVELSILSILIKNGIIGLCGYLLIYIRWFLISLKTNFKIRNYYLAVYFTLIVSAFVENYITNMHVLFGLTGYLILSCFSSFICKRRVLL
ncbi:hypothetical protein ACE15W_08630 [Bifidobacterium catenulatum subsp. kashiwanohense]|uniref:hypothetical protein n=1 Tax=Bifidobacterium TaxID=1678 RepID=UPI0022E120C7|nr:hypothetical protein [Bifidobacterium adolescentis]